MWAYQFLTILLIVSLPFFPEQFVAATVRVIIVIFSILLLPIFPKALLADIKRKFAPTLFFLAFLIPVTIATIISTEIQQAAKQLLMFYSYFIIFVSLRSVFKTLLSKELFAACYLLLATCLSLISLYNTLIRHYVSRDSLSFLWVYFGHNHLSALLVFAIPLALYFLKTYWNNKQIRTLSIVTCFLLLVSLLFTFSISAMFSIAAAFLLSLVLFGKTFGKKISPNNFLPQKIYFIVFLIIGFFGISLFFIFSETRGIKDLNLSKDPPMYAEARFTYWRAAYDNFLENPLTGTGLETFGEVLAKSGDIGKAAYTTHAHNFFIQMLTDTGIFGFLTSIALIASVLWEGLRHSGKPRSAGRIQNLQAFRDSGQALRQAQGSEPSRTARVTRTEIDSRNFFYLSLFTGLLSSTLLAIIDLDWHAPTVFLFFWIFASISVNKTYAK